MSCNGSSIAISIRRNSMRVLLVAIVFAALVAARGVATAQAYSYQNTGCAGSVQVPAIIGYYNSIGPAFEFPQRYAWRSPCYSAYTQVINVRYRMWSFNLQTRQWGFYFENWRTAPTVAPGYAGA